MAQPGRPQRKPQSRRRLHTPGAPAGGALAATSAAAVGDAPGTSTALRDRRRARAHVRDYMYVRAEVRAILLLALLIVVAITVVSFFFQ